MSRDSNTPKDPTEPTASVSRCDEAAQAWDDKPSRAELATAVAMAMGKAVPFQPDIRIMDFGGGTGLISRTLAPQLEALGFTTLSIETVHAIRRPPAEGAEPQDYRVFLLVAQKIPEQQGRSLLLENVPGTGFQTRGVFYCFWSACVTWRPVLCLLRV